MANIMIIDDHPMARLAIRMLLEKDGHVITAESGDGMEAFKIASKENPDVVVVDLDIPSLSGIELIEKLRRNSFTGRLLVLTGRDDEHYLNRCINIGADGFVGKGNNLDELREAVRAMVRGYGYFPLRRQAGIFRKAPASEVEAVQLLSSRELQVLRYLSRGMKIIDISDKMHISNKTVSTYKTRLLTKLQLNSTLELIDFSRRHSLD